MNFGLVQHIPCRNTVKKYINLRHKEIICNLKQRFNTQFHCFNSFDRPCITICFDGWSKAPPHHYLMILFFFVVGRERFQFPLKLAFHKRSEFKGDIIAKMVKQSLAEIFSQEDMQHFENLVLCSSSDRGSNMLKSARDFLNIPSFR